ncbi:hypothetical protein LS77_008685 [Helicobacter bilis]|uniref:Uncharacterized protein n=2 Tax=Helicobacter bilis TaxID=37372 RepID=A0A6D2C7K9_9HELI|nr:hypothetical protein [Helicobacter bilis]EMZ37272.1 hypothetical protein C826_02134 [Helicobacter bilis WiWa]TLE03572.1 hypothetical protein LS77_008685 [Helicobacter bilis]TLE04302.1 hypothetical protein LS76_008705 [Helicobacter bilis]
MLGVLTKGINKVMGGGKLTAGLDKVGKFAAPVQAATSVVGLGMDIYNTIEANKQMKEQMDLARKSFNLELEKQQKYELANNQLAASVDKAWGGSGEVAPTIDYSKYRPAVWDSDEDDNLKEVDNPALIQGGAGQGMVMGANSSTKPRSIEDMPQSSLGNGSNDSNPTTQGSMPTTNGTPEANLEGSGNTLMLGSVGMPQGYSDTINTDNDYEEDGAEAS